MLDTGSVQVAAAPVSAADRPEFIEAVRASRALHQPWIDPPDSGARFAAYLQRFRSSDQYGYVLRHATCGGLVGFVNLSNVVRGALQSASVGYGAFVGHEGRGLMTEGLRSVIAIAFVDLDLHRVEANIQPGNRRSIALVRRLGFEREGFSPRFLLVGGEWRDHERWALRSDDFRAPG